MPRPRGSPVGKERDDLTLFGRFFYSLCDALQTSQYVVAKRSGVSQANISRYTSGDKHPQKRSVVQMWQAFEEIAAERHIKLNRLSRAAFFNCLDYASPAQERRASVCLAIFRAIYLHEEIHDLAGLLQEYIAEEEIYLAELKSVLSEEQARAASLTPADNRSETPC